MLQAQTRSAWFTNHAAECLAEGRRLVWLFAIFSSVTVVCGAQGETQLPETTSPADSTDGTWRQDGRYIVLNLNGQQYRLVQSDQSDPPPSPAEPAGGVVRGRLANQGRPLARFDVALVPLKKTWLGFAIVRSVESDQLTTLTDASGAYRFANVPEGIYKLKWRAPGESSWIRRVELRPDVRVRLGEETVAKEIRVALRTIN